MITFFLIFAGLFFLTLVCPALVRVLFIVGSFCLILALAFLKFHGLP
jgi:hypothetical protein